MPTFYSGDWAGHSVNPDGSCSTSTSQSPQISRPIVIAICVISQIFYWWWLIFADFSVAATRGPNNAINQIKNTQLRNHFSYLWLSLHIPSATYHSLSLSLLLSSSITAAISLLPLPSWSLTEAPRPAPVCLKRTRTSSPLSRLPPSHSLREAPRNQGATCWHQTLPSSTGPPTAPLRNLRRTPAELSGKNEARWRQNILIDEKHSASFTTTLCWCKCFMWSHWREAQTYSYVVWLCRHD